MAMYTQTTLIRTAPGYHRLLPFHGFGSDDFGEGGDYVTAPPQGGTIDGQPAPGRGIDLSGPGYQLSWPGVVQTAEALATQASTLYPNATPVGVNANVAPAPAIVAPGKGSSSPVLLVLGAVALWYFLK